MRASGCALRVIESKLSFRVADLVWSGWTAK